MENKKELFKKLFKQMSLQNTSVIEPMESKEDYASNPEIPQKQKVRAYDMNVLKKNIINLDSALTDTNIQVEYIKELLTKVSDLSTWKEKEIEYYKGNNSYILYSDWLENEININTNIYKLKCEKPNDFNGDWIKNNETMLTLCDDINGAYNDGQVKSILKNITIIENFKNGNSFSVPTIGLFGYYQTSEGKKCAAIEFGKIGEKGDHYLHNIGLLNETPKLYYKVKDITTNPQLILQTMKSMLESNIKYGRVSKEEVDEKWKLFINQSGFESQFKIMKDFRVVRYDGYDVIAYKDCSVRLTYNINPENDSDVLGWLDIVLNKLSNGDYTDFDKNIIEGNVYEIEEWTNNINPIELKIELIDLKKKQLFINHENIDLWTENGVTSLLIEKISYVDYMGKNYFYRKVDNHFVTSSGGRIIDVSSALKYIKNNNMNVKYIYVNEYWKLPTPN